MIKKRIERNNENNNYNIYEKPEVEFINKLNNFKNQTINKKLKLIQEKI